MDNGLFAPIIPKYLRGADIVPPVIEIGPYGVRFTLTDSAVPSSAYSERAAAAEKRATLIFEAVRSRTTIVGVLAYTWMTFDPDDPFVQLTREAGVALELTEGENYWGVEEADEHVPFLRATAPLGPRALDHKSLFKAIANSDLGEKPATAWKIFLLGASPDLVLHMYDDRGLDVITPSKRLRDELVVTLRAWVLRVSDRGATP